MENGPWIDPIAAARAVGTKDTAGCSGSPVRHGSNAAADLGIPICERRTPSGVHPGGPSLGCADSPEVFIRTAVSWWSGADGGTGARGRFRSCSADAPDCVTTERDRDQDMSLEPGGYQCTGWMRLKPRFCLLSWIGCPQRRRDGDSARERLGRGEGGPGLFRVQETVQCPFYAFLPPSTR